MLSVSEFDKDCELANDACGCEDDAYTPLLGLLLGPPPAAATEGSETRRGRTVPVIAAVGDPPPPPPPKEAAADEDVPKVPFKVVPSDDRRGLELTPLIGERTFIAVVLLEELVGDTISAEPGDVPPLILRAAVSKFAGGEGCCGCFVTPPPPPPPPPTPPMRAPRNGSAVACWLSEEPPWW